MTGIGGRRAELEAAVAFGLPGACIVRTPLILAALLSLQPAMLSQSQQTPHPAPIHAPYQNQTSRPPAAPAPRPSAPFRAPSGPPSRLTAAPQSRPGPPAGPPAEARPAYGSGGVQNGPPSHAPRPLITAHPAPGLTTPGNPERPSDGRMRPPYVPRSGGERSNVPGGQHLPSWLANHQGESLLEQQQSLRQERGFNRLPAPQQQRLMNHLQQLDSMPPQQRQRTLSRIENMERLSPEKRQEVRSAAQQMGRLTPDRQQSLRQAFRELRDVPPGERQQLLHSPAYRSRFSDGERGILGNLLSVEPYQPR